MKQQDVPTTTPVFSSVDEHTVDDPDRDAVPDGEAGAEKEDAQEADIAGTDAETAAAVADREATVDHDAAVGRGTRLEETPGASGTTDVAPTADVPEVPEARDVPDTALEHAPGEVEASPVADLWPAGTADSLRERWRELQLLFVDDPQGAAAQADGLAAEAIAALTTSLSEVRQDLAEWRMSRDADTEGLRIAVQRYQTFLDKVLAL